MFRETLLESAPGARRRKRWPMILAVALEVTVCSLLVALPLFSTGIISVSAQPPRVTTQLEHITIVEHPSTNATPNPGHSLPAPHSDVVTVADGRPFIFRPAQNNTDGPEEPPNIRGFDGPALSRCDVCSSTTTRTVVPGNKGPYPVSDLTEGSLLHRVEPTYPRPAILAGIRGEVRLHAIIAKDGTIQSLTVISGHPMLVTAALDAVRQWRYRPYLLNHEPVEVETLITVNFTGAR
jgi:protein TonB